MQELIQAQNLTKTFSTGSGLQSLFHTKQIKAVDDVSFSIRGGESFGLVGESGSGKTTVGKILIGLMKPSSGRVLYGEKDIFSLNEKSKRAIRPKLQPIYQDADSSLDPRYTVERLLTEPLKLQHVAKAEASTKVAELMQAVNLGPELLKRYPHELSGGQRQRIGMARALALHPELIVADEPAASLDLSVQAQVLELLSKARQERGIGILYISHNLRMVRIMTGRMAVIYCGSIVEIGQTEAVFTKPLHPYTQMLISSLLPMDPEKRGLKRADITGDTSEADRLCPGCRFRRRCKYSQRICEELAPQLRDVGNDRQVACHLYGR